ncbi:2-octaprenyl-6-methoxyphenyl hydroxylase [Candidatus Litorirhabdus singularis]|nr:2-octaprenyl-6-methoxyphenyl hydroxylase [Candidatus Litorirhabdus singularis]
MSAADTCDVAIVGGGMVGVSLALALAQTWPQKRRIVLLESFPLPGATPDFAAGYSPSFDARSTALSYSSCLIYQELGIWEQLLQRACPIARIHVSDRGRFGHALLQAQECDWPALGYVIENAWLGNILIQCLHEQGRVELISPATVTGAKIDDAGMALELANGERLQTQLLIVADGAQSGLREALGIDTDTRRYDQHAVVANIGHALPHGGCAWERFTRNGPLALLPLLPDAAAPHRSALVWTLPPLEAERMAAASEVDFLQSLQQAFGYRLGRLQRLGERASYPLNLVQAKEQVRSGLVVIGNAAHALHPVAGQGFNLALRDVARLVDVLGDAEVRGEDFAALTVLQRYANAQRRDQQRTVEFSDRLPALFMRHETALGALRDVGLIGLDLIPALRREFVQQTAGTAASAEYRRVQP